MNKKPPPLGTIIPTKQSLIADDEYFKGRELAASKIEKTMKGKRMIINGEIRFYTDNNHYSIVSRRNLTVLKFEVRADGDYRI